MNQEQLKTAFNSAITKIEMNFCQDHTSKNEKTTKAIVLQSFLEVADYWGINLPDDINLLLNEDDDFNFLNNANSDSKNDVPRVL